VNRADRAAGNRVESDEFGKFAARIVRAYGRRIGDGDLWALGDLVKLRDLVDQAVTDGVAAAREAHDFSWTDVARELGVSRQAARQRYGKAAS
jgi:hypothetical protein